MATIRLELGGEGDIAIVYPEGDCGNLNVYRATVMAVVGPGECDVGPVVAEKTTDPGDCAPGAQCDCLPDFVGAGASLYLPFNPTGAGGSACWTEGYVLYVFVTAVGDGRYEITRSQVADGETPEDLVVATVCPGVSWYGVFSFSQEDPLCGVMLNYDITIKLTWANVAPCPGCMGDTGGTPPSPPPPAPCDIGGDVMRVYGSATHQGAGYHAAASSGALERWTWTQTDAIDVSCPADGSPACDGTYVYGGGTGGTVGLNLPITVAMDGVGICSNTPPPRHLDVTLTVSASMDASGRWIGYVYAEGYSSGSASSSIAFSYFAYFEWSGTDYTITSTDIYMNGASISAEEEVIRRLAASVYQDDGSCALHIVMAGNFLAYQTQAHCPGSSSKFTANWGTAPYVVLTLAIEQSGARATAPPSLPSASRSAFPVPPPGYVYDDSGSIIPATHRCRGCGG